MGCPGEPRRSANFENEISDLQLGGKGGLEPHPIVLISLHFSSALNFGTNHRYQQNPPLPDIFARSHVADKRTVPRRRSTTLACGASHNSGATFAHVV